MIVMMMVVVGVDAVQCGIKCRCVNGLGMVLKEEGEEGWGGGGVGVF